MSASDLDSDGITALGYDAEFSPELDDKYKCPVCLLALRDPQQTACGHRFCKICLTRSRGRSQLGKCPVDKTVFTPSQVFDDNATRREVLSLTIKCDNHKDKCLWRGELRQRESHVSHCPEARMSCSNECGHVCSRRLIPTHLVMCRLRKECCAKCGLNLLASEIAKHHLLVCEKFPLTCTVCGEVELARENMARHTDVINGDCPMIVVKCRFEMFGCYFQEKRKNMDAHNMTSHGHHNQLVMIKLRQQDDVMIGLTEQYRKMALAMKDQQRFIEEQGQILRLHGSCIRELQHEHDARLLWRFALPADRTSPITSPALVLRRCGTRLRLVLDPVSSLAGRPAATVSLTVDGRPADGRPPLEAVCRLTIFARSRLADDYADQFAFVLGAEQPDGAAVGRQGLFGFMPTDRLYAGPYADGGNVVAFVAIDAKSD